MMNPLRFVAKLAFDKRLNETGPSLTFRRLCTSRHVDDLQVVVTIAAAAFLTALLFQGPLFGQSSKHEDGTTQTSEQGPKSDFSYFTAIFAAAATVLGWAYQAGSKRLGVVDLFATEISTICRVCLVVDFATTSEKKAQVLPLTMPRPRSPNHQPPSDTFTSEEHYTPVYDGSVAELQALDFDVVKNVTCFYTYRKTMLDYMRRIAASPASGRAELYHQMIYMQYLMYESARLAVGDLIEFEPDRSESLINILCSELQLFAYLAHVNRGNFKGARLQLRLEEYEKTIGKIYHVAMSMSDQLNWLKARTTAPELKQRYDNMLKKLERDQDADISSF